MKFTIKRVADRFKTNPPPPIKGCTQVTFSGLNEYGNQWTTSEWVVDVGTLEELLDLGRTQGEKLVVHYEDGWTGMPSIEIYDDYLE